MAGHRNDYAQEAVKRYPERFAVMGRIALDDPETAALLPRWKEQPGMLGIRLTFQREQAALLTDGTADWFWPAAEKAGMPIMFFAPGNIRCSDRSPNAIPGSPSSSTTWAWRWRSPRSGASSRRSARWRRSRDIRMCR